MARRLKAPPATAGVATPPAGSPADLAQADGEAPSDAEASSDGAAPSDGAAVPDGLAAGGSARRRWLPGQSREVRPANALGDVELLVRVRDCLKELPDEPARTAKPIRLLRIAKAGQEGKTVQAEQPDESEQAEPGAALAAIRDTFERVAVAGDMAAAYFYGWLFVGHPGLRDLFPPAMDEQRDRLFQALTRIVHSLNAPQDMATYLAELGRDHRKYDVKPEMYAAVGDALLATLRAFSGDAFTPQAEEAWTQTYGVASDLMIKAAADADVRTPASWPAEVVQHEKRSRDIAVLTVATDQPLPYQAGQHVTVQTRRWPRVWRPYSIACRPREDGLIRFHVKAISGGWVSTALVEHTGVGDPLIIGPAVGTMTLAAAADRDLVCVGGGTGLAPMKAIAEQVVYQESMAHRHRNISLFYGARTESDFYDLRDLWRLSDVYPWLQVYAVASDDPAYQGMQGNVGRVAARYLPHADCAAFVAGPQVMVRDTIQALTKAGLPAERIHFDDGVLNGRPRVGTGT